MVGGDAGSRAHLEPIFKTLAPGPSGVAPTPGREDRTSTAEDGYLHCGPPRRRPLREDDPQRHRVRPDAGLRRRLRHPAERGLARSCPRSCASTSTSPTSPNCGGAAASSPRGCSISTRERARGGSRARPRSPAAVQDSGEGRWTIMAAIEEAVAGDVLAAVALRALPLAAGSHLRREAALGHALQVRRPRRDEVERRPCLIIWMTERSQPAAKRTSATRAVHAASPCLLVIFGASGDLTKRKLIPALYNLAQGRLLPDEFAVVGVVAIADERRGSSGERCREDLQECDGREAGRHRALELAARARALRRRASSTIRRPTPAAPSASTSSTSSARPAATSSSTWRRRRSCSAPIVEQLGDAGLTTERDGHWRRVDHREAVRPRPRIARER